MSKNNLLLLATASICLFLTALTSRTTVTKATVAATSTAGGTATVVATEISTSIPNPCKLPEAANRGDVGLGFPRYSSRMASTGIVRAKVLFVDFSDVPAKQTPKQVFAMLSPGAPDFYKVVSYGRMNYQLEPYFKWLRMSKPSTEYSTSFSEFDTHRAYIQEAVNLAGKNVDYSGVQAVYVIANPQAEALAFGPAFTGAPDYGGFTAGGTTFYNGATSGHDLNYWGFLWLNHEVAHTMGLVDLYAYEGDDYQRFVGDFSLMGNIGGTSPENFAYERWLLGWLDDDQIVCQQTDNATTQLTPIEKKGGTKAVMVLTGPTSAVVVESRRALGYDSKLSKAGALVYTVDTSIASGEGPIKVLPDKDTQKLKSPLGAGESVKIGNVTIKVGKATADGDTIQVTVTR